MSNLPKKNTVAQSQEVGTPDKFISNKLGKVTSADKNQKDLPNNKGKSGNLNGNPTGATTVTTAKTTTAKTKLKADDESDEDFLFYQNPDPTVQRNMMNKNKLKGSAKSSHPKITSQTTDDELAAILLENRRFINLRKDPLILKRLLSIKKGMKYESSAKPELDDDDDLSSKKARTVVMHILQNKKMQPWQKLEMLHALNGSLNPVYSIFEERGLELDRLSLEKLSSFQAERDRLRALESLHNQNEDGKIASRMTNTSNIDPVFKRNVDRELAYRQRDVETRIKKLEKKNQMKTGGEMMNSKLHSEQFLKNSEELFFIHHRGVESVNQKNISDDNNNNSSDFIAASQKLKDLLGLGAGSHGSTANAKPVTVGDDNRNNGLPGGPNGSSSSWIYGIGGNRIINDSSDSKLQQYPNLSLMNEQERRKYQHNLRKRLQIWDKNMQISFSSNSSGGNSYLNNPASGQNCDHNDDVLSEPESVLSVDSISGEIKSSWDSGVKHSRWMYPTDRSVPFTQAWGVEDWHDKLWRGRLKDGS